jgi:Uma2 family endonuclease
MYNAADKRTRMTTGLRQSDRRTAPATKLTFEEFLAWADENTCAEWVEGEVVMMSPASIRHQEIGSFLEGVLRVFVEHHGLGTLIRAPFVMKSSEGRGREPDLLFVCRDRAHLIRPAFLDGPADLVIEILSPESIGRDRGEKFVEYEAAGIREYWLIDPERQRAEFCELHDGRYRIMDAGAERYLSKVLPGLTLRLEWLWRTPPPATLSVLRELGVV